MRSHRLARGNFEEFDMFEKQDRRSFLKVAAATGALGAVGARPAEAATPSRVSNLKLAEPQPFSFEALKQEAQRLVKEPYRQPNVPSPEITSQIDYERWGHITYNTDHALFADTKERFPVEFFHLGMFFKKAVKMHVVENGAAREILYDPSYFNMPEDSIARQLPPGAGFAGFRIQESKDGALDWKKNDWVAFLGAS
jgi:glucans biosynthesis protein